jgi:hypothetical protein
MPEAKVRPIQPEVKITEEQVQEINFPELSNDKFSINDKEYAIRVLPWKWEMLFRKHTMPLMEAEFKPIEKLIFTFQSESYLVDKDLGITESIFASEALADECITKGVAVICISQDPTVRARAANGEELLATEYQALEKKYRVMIENAEELLPSPRAFLREVITRQMEKQKMVQALGESVLTRFENFAGLVGTDKNAMSSLRALFMQQVRSILENAGQVAQTLVKSSGLPTDGSSATLTQNFKANLIKAKESIERSLERFEPLETPPPAAEPEKPTEPPPPSDELPKQNQEQSAAAVV